MLLNVCNRCDFVINHYFSLFDEQCEKLYMRQTVNIHVWCDVCRNSYLIFLHMICNQQRSLLEFIVRMFAKYDSHFIAFLRFILGKITSGIHLMKTN